MERRVLGQVQEWVVVVSTGGSLTSHGASLWWGNGARYRPHNREYIMPSAAPPPAETSPSSPHLSAKSIEKSVLH